MKKIEAGQVLEARSFADYDCIFRVTVLRRTPKMAVVRYFEKEYRCKVHTNSQGDEYIAALGTYSMAPLFYGLEVEEPVGVPQF